MTFPDLLVHKNGILPRCNAYLYVYIKFKCHLWSEVFAGIHILLAIFCKQIYHTINNPLFSRASFYVFAVAICLTVVNAFYLSMYTWKHLEGYRMEAKYVIGIILEAFYGLFTVGVFGGTVGAGSCNPSTWCIIKNDDPFISLSVLETRLVIWHLYMQFPSHSLLTEQKILILFIGSKVTTQNWDDFSLPGCPTIFMILMILQ